MSQRHVCRLLGSPWRGVFGTDTESAREYGRHWHTTYGFGLMERGAHRSASGRGVVEARAGDIITTNPGEVHDGKPLGEASRRWRMVYLEASVMASLAGEHDGPAADVRLTEPVIQDASLAVLLRKLLRGLGDRCAPSPSPAGSDLSFEEALVRACAALLGVHSTVKPITETDVDVAPVRERLADDLVSSPSLGDLAAMVGLSRYQLLRRFERVYGFTPFRWQAQVRVERARALIAAGQSLAQVALDCGFADQSHMTRAFTAHFGFAPGSWARSLAVRTR